MIKLIIVLGIVSPLGFLSKKIYEMQLINLVQKTISVRRYDEPLNKYVYLNDLLCTNERLFYKLLSENVEELMPIVYTPTVGLACQKFGYIFSKPQVNVAIL